MDEKSGGQQTFVEVLMIITIAIVGSLFLYGLHIGLMTDKGCYEEYIPQTRELTWRCPAKESKAESQMCKQ